MYRSFRPSLATSTAFLLALVGFSSATIAQESDDSKTSEDRVIEERVIEEEIEIEGEAPEIPALTGVGERLGVESEDFPASLSTLDHEILTEQTALVLSDALRNVPGTNVQTGTSPFDIFYIRGFDSVAGTLVLTDGAIEPESTFLHLYNIERVEVLRGSSGGFLYGGRALAGTVNLVRKKPAATDFYHFGLVAGSEAYGQATIDANWALSESTGFRLNGLWHTADNYRDDNGADAFAIHPSWSWTGERTRVTVDGEFVSNEYAPDGGLPIVGGEIPDVPRERSFDSPLEESDQETTRFQVNVEHQLSDRTELRAKLFYTDLDWISSGTILSGAFPTGPGSAVVLRTQTFLDDRQTFAGLQAELATRFDTGGVSHELLFGVEADRLDDEFQLDVGLLPSTDLTGFVFPGSPDLVPIPSQSRFGDVTSDVLATWLIDRITFSDAFELYLGGRFDSIEFDGSGTALDRDDDEFSPLVGVVVSPGERVSLYANYAESFEPQSTLAIGEVIPEEGEQVEAGVKFDLLGGKVRADLAWFRLEKANIAIPDRTGVQTQTGDQESEGVELEVVAALAEDLDLRLGFAHLDAELTEFSELVVFGGGPGDFVVLDRSGNTPAFAPENLFTSWLTKRFDNGVGLGFGARYVDEQFIAEDNAFALEDYWLVDAAFFYVWNKTQFNLNLLNLADEEYFTRAFGKTSVSPAPGFEVRAGVRYLF